MFWLNLAVLATTEPPLATKEVPFAYDCKELPKATLVANLAVSATTEPPASAVKCAALEFPEVLEFVALIVIVVNS